MLTCNFLHPTWHCRGEQADLYLALNFTNRSQDPFNVLLETKFEHLVSFIQHNGLDVGEIDVASLDVIKYSTCRSNKDFDAILEVTNLRFNWHSTIHSRTLKLVGFMLEILKSIGDLASELPGWRKNYGLNLATSKLPLLPKSFNNWQCKSEGLPRAS